MNNYFEKYQKIKNKLSYQYQGYNLGEIIAFYIIYHIYFERKNELEGQAYRIILSQIKQHPYIDNLQDICEYPGIVFTIPKNQSRCNDYCELIELTSQKISQSVSFILDIKTDSKSVPLFSKTFLLFLVTFISNCTKLFNLLTIKEIFWFSCRLQFYRNFIDALERTEENKLKIKKYITFNGALNYENMLVKFFQKRDIPTYSLQHAIMDSYFLNQDSPPYDLINIENIQTDYLLCWSKNTISQIIDSAMTSTELLLVGNPKYTQWEIDKVKQSFKKCLVFLGRKGGELVNEEVIEIIQKLSKTMTDVEFFIKLHPQNLDDTYYKEMAQGCKMEIVPTNENLSTLLSKDDFDFTVSYNLTTTVYYESLCYGLPCFRYNRDKIINVYGLENDNFSTLEELRERILYFQQVESSMLLVEVREMLKQTMGINLDNYHQYFSQFA
ncbi:hypothetical protein WH8501_17645 [Crocosphaera watsonii WH 8501]|uniref:Uncharacterized protein n=1 Tax=Crocosphaera watsonii WH 8501 TaxID=165597 RepID=Q4C551_CROWT|nr:hypothetical protein [Crocosphaera watsonii]EAM51261.1 hypothetical protein CwatDRAFT_4429 [Crocosphaera watsonii WH 8501]